MVFKFFQTANAVKCCMVLSVLPLLVTLFLISMQVSRVQALLQYQCMALVEAKIQDSNTLTICENHNYHVHYLILNEDTYVLRALLNGNVLFSVIPF
jgi:hypothetical protein